jgi:hypothetical protein
LIFFFIRVAILHHFHVRKVNLIFIIDVEPGPTTRPAKGYITGLPPPASPYAVMLFTHL